MAPESAHPWDGIADELTAWIDGESDWYVDALKSGHRSPFAAPLSEAEKRQYFLPRVFAENPDGSINYDSPNQQGRDELVKQYGTQGFAEIVASVMPKQGRREIPTGSAPAPAVPTDQIDTEAG